METLSSVGLSVAGFLATNGDNLMILLAFLADRAFRARQVVAGYALAMAGLLALSLVSASLGHVIPVEYLGLLGFIPLFLGLRKLYELIRRRDEADEAPPHASAGRSNVLTVAGFELAGGSDTVAVFAPLLAESKPWPMITLCATFAAMTAIWCWLAVWICHHPTLGGHVRRYARFAVPFLMIGLGLYILYDTATDLFDAEQAAAATTLPT